MAETWFEHLDARHAMQIAEGLARELKVYEGTGVHLTICGKSVVSFASNDYLGLSKHPNMPLAAEKAVARYGSGATSSPLICGNKAIHAALAQALGEFKGTESALLFPSGYQAALATLGALADDATTILLDKLSHASLIDGAKLSGARMRTFHHNDVADLARLLDKESGQRCIVVIESLYSMDGDTAPVAEILALTKQRGALLLVDEAHATGVLGENGRGLVSGPAADREHAIIMGTLSKALGSQGGFICASQRIVQAVLTGRAHLFSTGLAPACAAAALAALELLYSDPERREQIAENAAYVRCEMKRLNIATPSTEGPIIPAMIGDEKRALIVAERLFERGYCVPAVRFPTVKRGAARLRISVSAAHTREECTGLMRELDEVIVETRAQ